MQYDAQYRHPRLLPACLATIRDVSRIAGVLVVRVSEESWLTWEFGRPLPDHFHIEPPSRYRVGS